MYTVTLLCVTVAVLWYVVSGVLKPRKYPPGPQWYPYFGSSAIVQKLMLKHGSQWKALSHLAKEYSTDILGLKLGSERLVVLFGEKNLRIAFKESAFDGRPDNYFLRLRCLGKRMGITFTDGPLWKEHRSFTVKHLKNVGFGKTTMEAEVQKEMLHIIDYIDKNRHKPINPKGQLAISVMNTLWKFTAGERIDDDKLMHLIDVMERRSKAFTMSGGKLNQWPWLRFLFPQWSGYNLIKSANKQMSEIIDDAIDKHRNGEITEDDFMHLFLNEVRQGRSTYTEEQLQVICLDILIAGSQTTSNSLQFALLAALRNPSIQNRIYDEINTVLGDQTPCWEDTNRLIYTMAFLYEVQRYFVIVPLAGPRRLLTDFKLGEYVLPKETSVLICVGDTHFDPEIWEEPEKFNPDRFIGEDGSFVNLEHIYPFGQGRRRCPGDSLARSFLFIVFVGILQKYKINCCNGVLPSDEPDVGILSSPKPFSIDFIPRQNKDVF
ncbi:probable cytochrome P450 305a1 [Aricia agestis]|uniref:probable cytochrome P450 305a1 n=1 Tax=Aricia agestis TaxID=91739 RepID=UPI001C205F0B|nr:probable cytochrome P450 305a1 [Aricia agestis]